MLFKLSVKNMKKSFKDYAIYFLTLVLGVAIFYMFNSLDSQQAMLDVSASTRDMIKLMISMLSYISVFVAIVLGLLIVYANNFLINRRKREFGIYMTLGMGKRQISKIILFETILVGILSLGAGIIIGVFASQFMSILVGKLFEADMTTFEFVFSKDACIKTCIYFAVMYIAVMIFNTITISKYKLINLLTANKKNEAVKIKNPIISIMIFLLGAGILGYCYWKVTGGIDTLSTADKILPIILMGIIGTVAVFWSLSGFILRIIQSRKSTYLMLFMTISILSSSFSLQSTMKKDLQEMTPVDLNLYKTANLPEKYTDRYGKEYVNTKEAIEDSKKPISETLKENDYDMNRLKDIVEIPIYGTEEWTWKVSLGNYNEEAKKQYPMILYDTEEMLIKVSDYNKITKLYGNEELTVEDDEYIVLCDFTNQVNLRNMGLKDSGKININGKIYHSKYSECKPGYILMSTSHTNTGIMVVPDNFNLKEEWKQQHFLAANYNAETEEEKEIIEEDFGRTDTNLYETLNKKNISLMGMSKISIIQASVGVATIVVFIAIYLGIVFLIASSAILALKQLTESSDNKQRYIILRKIGCDEKMINQALFRQIAIFFMLPLLLAIIHSIFGIQFVMSMMSVLASAEELLPSIIVTVIIIGIIYGAYFAATYFVSKNIIKEEE